MKLRYNGHKDGEKVGIDPGVLDAHMRPLVNPSLVDIHSPRARFVVESGKPFVIDHTDHARGLNWVAMCSHNEFSCCPARRCRGRGDR